MGYLTPQQKTDLLALIEASGLSGEPDNDVVANTLSRTIEVATPGEATTRYVPLSEIQALGYRLGIIPKLEAALEGPAKVLARITLNLLTSKVDPVDVRDRAFGAMLDQLQAATLLTQPERTAIEGLSIVPARDVVTESSPFGQAFPDFYHKVDGVGYARCTAALIAEARA